MAYRFIVAAASLTIILAAGFPIAFAVVHGPNPLGWPDGVETPAWWWRQVLDANISAMLNSYAAMVLGYHDAFPHGGRFASIVIAISVALSSGAVVFSNRQIRRDASGAYGNAQWATRDEVRVLNRGLEIGIAAETGSPVRAQFEGNFVTIAPPRRGKTGGLVIPNLAAPDRNSWVGPVVVIDPKADVYRACARRRSALGQQVRCVDPLGIAGGTDSWNPILHLDSDDVIGIQGLVLAFFPSSANETDSAAYFRFRGADLLVGAISASIAAGKPDLVHAARLLTDHDAFLGALGTRSDAASVAAREILRLDERTRGSIVSTAQNATQFLRDVRMQRAVTNHTFELDQLLSGSVDLFLVLPADERKIVLAPYIRCLLSSLFSITREQRPKERILVFIDEAATLGNFDAILNGVGELPGRGISLWTIWQSRQQMVDVYGESGAEILLATSEMTNLFGLAASQPDELERWSAAIGSFTGVAETASRDPLTKKVTISTAAVERRLVPATDLPALLQKQQVVFFNSDRYSTRPMKLLRTSAYTDPRFRGLIDLDPPTGRAG